MRAAILSDRARRGAPPPGLAGLDPVSRDALREAGVLVVDALTAEEIARVHGLDPGRALEVLQLVSPDQIRGAVFRWAAATEDRRRAVREAVAAAAAAPSGGGILSP